jgi:hypothetical protein
MVFKSNLTLPKLSPFCIRLNRNIIGGGLVLEKYAMIISAWAGNGEIRETIKMVAAESKRAADPNLKVGENEKLYFRLL